MNRSLRLPPARVIANSVNVIAGTNDEQAVRDSGVAMQPSTITFAANISYFGPALHYALQFGDVPGPKLIGRGGQQLRAGPAIET